MHIDNGNLVGAKVGSISCLPHFGEDANIDGIVVTIVDTDTTPTLGYQDYKFIQTEELTAIGVAVHPYGAIVVSRYGEDHYDAEKVIVKFGDNEYGIALEHLLDGAYAGEALTFEPIEDEGSGGDQGGST